MIPIFWVWEIDRAPGKPMRTACTTIGAAPDFASAGVRRIMVNSCYWGLRMEDQIPAESDVSIVGEFKPTNFGFGQFVPNIRPEDHVWPKKARADKSDGQ